MVGTQASNLPRSVKHRMSVMEATVVEQKVGDMVCWGGDCRTSTKVFHQDCFLTWQGCFKISVHLKLIFMCLVDFEELNCMTVSYISWGLLVRSLSSRFMWCPLWRIPTISDGFSFNLWRLQPDGTKSFQLDRNRTGNNGRKISLLDYPRYRFRYLYLHCLRMDWLFNITGLQSIMKSRVTNRSSQH